jgi:hypothetical protein
MGIVERLKGLFSPGKRETPDTGLYVYVRLQRTGEVVRLRLAPEYELVPDYEAGGYVTHKSVVGPITYGRAEAVFRFDEGKRLVSWDITGGEMASSDDWDAQQTGLQSGAS